jgi:hypothetical protein
MVVRRRREPLGLEPFDYDGYGFQLGGAGPAPDVNHSIIDSAAWENAGSILRHLMLCGCADARCKPPGT